MTDAPSYPAINPPDVMLYGAGPSFVHPRVYRAMMAPIVGHLDPVFLEVMNETSEMLRAVFNTQNRVTFPVSGTGSAGMEAALVNVIEPGDPVVVGVNGVFGERMCAIVERCGGALTRIDGEWGRVIPPDRIIDAMRRVKARVVAVVHAETSTGVAQPLEEIGREAAATGAIFVVDAVTSLSGMPVDVDARQIDVAYSGSQKCLNAPPGLAPITFSEKALAKVHKRGTPVQSWYLDATLIERYWGHERTYHHTAPITMVYALHEALRIVMEEGLEHRYARHRTNAEAVWRALESLGLELLVPERERLWTLVTPKVPEGVDESAIRKHLMDWFKIEIAGGLGPLRGQIWRIGLMGEGSRPRSLETMLGAFGHVLREAGWEVDEGAGVSAFGAAVRGQVAHAGRP